MMRIKIGFVAVGLLLIVGLSSPVHAQSEKTSQSALAVSPAIIEQVLTPGKPVKFSLQVNNITSFPLPIKTVVRDFVVHSEELEKTDRARLDASQWFTIEEPDFILQPKQVRTVIGTMRPPSNAVPGGHYATIFFQPLVPQEALSPSTAYLNARVGVLAFLILKGDIEQKVSYASTLHTAGLIRHGPARFSFSLQNSGNTHLLPNGKLTIYDWRGRQVAKQDLPIGMILPDATKKYELQWRARWAFGKYRAVLEVDYGSDHIRLQKTTVSFWIVPWVEMLVGMVFLSLTGLFILKTHHRWRKAWRVLRGQDIRFR